jgi:hypothetical protein
MRKQSTDSEAEQEADRGVFTTREQIIDWLIHDAMAPVHYYFRVHPPHIGWDDASLYNLMNVEFGLLRKEVRTLTLPQLGVLFTLLHRVKSAANEQERQAVVAEARGLREPLAAVPGLAGAGVRAFAKALGSHHFLGSIVTGHTERKSDREILETLKAVGRRLTTRKLLAEMGQRGLFPAESTVKKRLAELVKGQRLINDPHARPRGYGLPEWSGSSGSRGS